MKLYELLENINDTYAHLKDIEVGKVTCDSRAVDEGDVFVCINGVSVDGHKFADKANEHGAAVIVCERDLGLENQIIVENTRKEYALMCGKYFGEPAKKIKLVGVTGTNGKTSTCMLLKHILESNGHKVGLIGTVQNMVGDSILPAKNTTPDAFELHSLFSLMVMAGCDYVVMEVSSHAIDQDRVYGLRFESAVFTNLTQDHLDYHKTMENYVSVKQRLFSMCNSAVVNLDDEYSEDILSVCKCKTVTYSTKRNDSSFSGKNIKQKVDGVDFEIVGDGLIGRAKIKTPGLFSVYNAMAAAVCAIELGLSFSDVLNSLLTAPKVKGRAEVVPTGKDFSVVIDYAHTPDGLKNILSVMNEVKEGRLITLFGCGGDRDKDKRPKMGLIASKYSDIIIVTSDNPRSEDPTQIINDIVEGIKGTFTPYEIIENRETAIQYAITHAQKGDIILLAGKGHETYQILSNTTIHLDEREIVANVLKGM